VKVTKDEVDKMLADEQMCGHLPGPDRSQGAVAGPPRKQSMLYEICQHCGGKGGQLPNGVNGLPTSGIACCKMLGVVETGATAGQLHYIAELDTLRQECGITAAMLRDGRARKIMDDAREAIKWDKQTKDEVLVRWDQTTPELQRGIVLRFAELATKWERLHDGRTEQVKTLLESLRKIAEKANAQRRRKSLANFGEEVATHELFDALAEIRNMAEVALPNQSQFQRDLEEAADDHETIQEGDARYYRPKGASDK
jgi:hypothetical protein